MLGIRSSVKTCFKPMSLTSKRLISQSLVASKSTYRTPNFDDVLKENNDADKGRSYAYFMVGAMGLLSSAGAKSTVETFISSMTATADVLAMAKVEVNLAAIPLGKTLLSNGKVSLCSLDTELLMKFRKPTVWICCVPIGEAGDFGGWFCPCHGSHYDISGRIRKGPAPLNLEIPAYEFDGDKVIVG
ncbi:Ubiquinol cytochrome reductase transmembrane region family protein [Saccharomyces cerevisiae]|nr:Ubiquinol cytochrome reductase transmembrane region family protein [Saccharomyces cerevisiae]